MILAPFVVHPISPRSQRPCAKTLLYFPDPLNGTIGHCSLEIDYRAHTSPISVHQCPSVVKKLLILRFSPIEFPILLPFVLLVPLREPLILFFLNGHNSGNISARTLSPHFKSRSGKFPETARARDLHRSVLPSASLRLCASISSSSSCRSHPGAGLQNMRAEEISSAVTIMG